MACTGFLLLGRGASPNLKLSTPLRTVSGTVTGLAGYYAIPVGAYITLTTGHNYAVAVKFKSNITGYNYPIPADGPKTGAIAPHAGMGTSTSYGALAAAGPYARLGSGSSAYIPCVRARTLKP
jgi:hypothetical protein